ncbi:Histidine kinase-, DNA gyrase B-, and HSP90-like ATPase [Micromonospora viridifaciens]|uniref:histidine kinase n=1 Tax=Micromonospora viridifaciens TaxID=1881 RepID=A0A1C4ZY90_MICVI|nr:nitrate- and nitrite sensing domain-containing protein [Micromonospora viridifaciens]SCF37930.1 Histidine kinase-, DNA gyrase B-, and HSP90-like ATPase [Micromonospora viridifaciens]
MRGRSGEDRIRLKLVALAALLITLWSYAAYLTGRDAADVVRVRALADTLGQPTDLLILHLQAERRRTAETIAGDGRARAELAEARTRTDRAAAPVRAFTEGHDLRLLTAGAVRDRANDLTRRLTGLATLRSEVDAGRLDRSGAVARYDQLIDAAFAVYGPEWGGRETALAGETRAVVALARARELLAREDTLLTAALAGGAISADEWRHLAELVATQRYARTAAVAELPATGREQHRRLVEGPRFAALLGLEDRLLLAAGAGVPAGVSGQSWRSAVDPALDGLRELVITAARASVERAAPGAALVIARTGTVVGLGLIAVLVALISWSGSVRRLAEGPKGFDRPGGSDAAETHVLPPPVGATSSATRELFLRLTQRNQVLLRDQLDLLDTMERRERSAEEIGDLFRLDHLATRIRRNVEKLVTLAGAAPARRWRHPVPLLDVVRGAVAEVADYHRVLVAPQWPWSLSGSGVTDVVHLLAELIENGLACSPEHTAVRVAGEHGPQGCSVMIVDDGPGLDTITLAEANELLSHPPSDGPPPGRAGLYVAALLAARCGARVRLGPGPRGGTAAVVLLPLGLVTETGDGTATGDGDGSVAGGAVSFPAQPGTGYPRASAAAAADSGGLPNRVRRPRATRPAPGTTTLDTAEMPLGERSERT